MISKPAKQLIFDIALIRCEGKGEKKPMDIIFNVFKDMDYAIYQELLG